MCTGAIAAKWRNRECSSVRVFERASVLERAGELGGRGSGRERERGGRTSERASAYQPPPPPPPPPPPENPPPPEPPNELELPLDDACVVAKLELETALDHRASVRNGDGPLYQSGAFSPVVA
jgi:hypothetical protein